MRSTGAGCRTSSTSSSSGAEAYATCCWRTKTTAERLLKAASAIPGVYVPALYEPRYAFDKSFLSLEPQDGDVPQVISRQITWAIASSSKPSHRAIPGGGSRLRKHRDPARLHEGVPVLPRRNGLPAHAGTRKTAEVVDACEQLARNCGYSELSLLSLSSSDYPEIGELVSDLNPLCRRENISLSLPSLRLGPESVRLLEALPGRQGSSFTFAPEAGTQRSAAPSNKNVTEDDIFTTLEALRDGGWTKLKLYFMIGLPTETEEDVAGIATLVRRIATFNPALRSMSAFHSLCPSRTLPVSPTARITACWSMPRWASSREGCAPNE